MARDPRYFPPHTLVEITNVTFQNRPLVRPSEELNDIFHGVLGRAQIRHGMPICAVVVLSTHFHLLAIPRDAEHLADFMRYLNTNLSKEIGRLHGWQGKLWHDRYHLVPISDEEKAQVRRLRYLLAAGVKEFLVDTVAEWPGVHSATALIEGTSLVGHWYDRTKEYTARQGQKEIDAEQFATGYWLELSPLPCWAHLPEQIWRRQVAAMVASINEDGAQERQREGKKAFGVNNILAVEPKRRPRKVKKSQCPRYHAASVRAFKRWFEGFREMLRVYRKASRRLREEGDRRVRFPEGTFPPALPFVSFPEAFLVEARGQPA